jgi:hypothetical protein
VADDGGGTVDPDCSLVVVDAADAVPAAAFIPDPSDAATMATQAKIPR